MNQPLDLLVDSAGNLIFSDAGNNRIRKVDAATGVISTIAGGGYNYFEGASPTSVFLNQPAGVALSSTGQLYIVDRGSNKVRVMALPTAVPATVALNMSQNPADPGQTVTFTATLTPSTATGTVHFTNGTNLYFPAPVVNGVATYSTSAIAPGTYPMQARYSGDASFLAFNTAFSNLTVKNSRSISLDSSLHPAATGQSITLTAFFSSNGFLPYPTGTVQFRDGATVLGNATITSLHASFATSQLPPGDHSLVAIYDGDAQHTPSTSPILTQTVKNVTATVLTSSLNPVTAGQSVTFTASLNPASATGTVQFRDGATVLGTVNVANGAAAFSTSQLAAGTHSIVAAYSGDALELHRDLGDAVAGRDERCFRLFGGFEPEPFEHRPVRDVHGDSELRVGDRHVAVPRRSDVLGTFNIVNGAAEFTTSQLSAGAT